MIHMTRFSVKNTSLAPFIKFIWYFEAENGDVYHKLLPTDCIDVILDLSDNMYYETGSKTIKAPVLHINGLRSRHSCIRQEGSIQTFGISFYAYGFYPFVNRSLCCLRDEVTDLSLLSPSLADELSRLTSFQTVEARLSYIEQTFAGELNTGDDYFQKSALIKAFLSYGPHITVQEFCRIENINLKTFERTVSCLTGYAPKALQRICRFQTASSGLIYHSPANLSHIAYENNFTDQAHFIKEFKHFSGAAPTGFSKEKATVKENVKYDYR